VSLHLCQWHRPPPYLHSRHCQFRLTTPLHVRRSMNTLLSVFSHHITTIYTSLLHLLSGPALLPGYVGCGEEVPPGG
jgi:hypothetical protein